MMDLEQPKSLDDSRWSQLARATASLALTGAALGWASALGEAGRTPAFMASNQLNATDRGLLALGTLGGAGVSVLLVLGIVIWKRWAAVQTVSRLASMLGPLAVLALLPAVLLPTAWYQNPLPCLVLLSGLVLAFERSLRSFQAAVVSPALGIELLRGHRPSTFRRLFPITIVLLAAAGFSAFVLYYSVQQHQRLHTAAYDLGIYDNLMFTAISGHPFRSTVLLGPDGGSYLAGHAEFAMLLFAPLYWLWPRAEMLLTLQAVALGFAAVPLYLFARTQLSRGAAVVLALAYLLYAPLHGSCFYDFHWLPISIFFQFTLYYSLATQKNWLFAACYVILTLIREDISVGLTVLGVFLLLSGIRPRLGLFIAVCSATSFLVIRFGIMMWAGSWVFPNLIYPQLVAPGEQGFGSVIKTLITNPAYVVSTLLDPKKYAYFLHLFAPLVFLPLRRGLLVLLICGGALFTFLTTGYEPTVSINFQYPAHWIPYLFAAVVLMLGVISRSVDGTLRRRAALGAIALGVAAHSYVFGAILQHETYVGGFLRLPYRITQQEKDTYAALRRVVAKIPREASVAATDMEVPHVSNRLSIYPLRAFHGDADYLLINRNVLTSDYRSILKDALGRNDYGLATSDGPFYLLKRDHPESPGTEQALKALGLRARDRKRTPEGAGR